MGNKAKPNGKMTQHRKKRTANALRNATLSEYLEQKILILTEDFCIKPTYEELEHLKTCTTEYQIDIACRKIIASHWDK